LAQLVSVDPTEAGKWGFVAVDNRYDVVPKLRPNSPTNLQTKNKSFLRMPTLSWWQPVKVFVNGGLLQKVHHIHKQNARGNGH